MRHPDLTQDYLEFLSTYDANAKDSVWREQSEAFHGFWKNRIENNDGPDLEDEECDVVIRLLDRSAKGNRPGSNAIAKAMISQGAWRRMFRSFRNNAELRGALNSVLRAETSAERVAAIDSLYRLNDGRRNWLTGPSGNAICTFLAISDPSSHVSVVSLRDRQLLLAFLGHAFPSDWEGRTPGAKIVESNDTLVRVLHECGVRGSARTLSQFCYSRIMKPRWKDVETIQGPLEEVDIIVPGPADSVRQSVASAEGGALVDNEVRESARMQALLSKIGAAMGFKIWLPRADRNRVMKLWEPGEGELLEDLPLAYHSSTLRTIELIDVIWLDRRTIVRAFEVEHTTSVFSGLLRMADLIALQPNLKIQLHIVAPDSRADKVLREIQRPVFALLEGGPLADYCTYISYSSITKISEINVLHHLSDSVIEDYEQAAE